MLGWGHSDRELRKSKTLGSEMSLKNYHESNPMMRTVQMSVRVCLFSLEYMELNTLGG